MKNKSQKTKSETKKSIPKPQAKKPRMLKLSKYSDIKLQKSISIKSRKKLPSSYKIFKNSLKHLKTYWKPFLMITIIYAFATIILVRGLSAGTDLSQAKESLNQLASGSQISNTLVLFSVLIGSSGSASNELASGYQTLLIVIFSLAIIWALRQTYASEKIKAKDSLYKGMYPIIPFILVILVISLHLIPMIIGSSIFVIVIRNGLAVTAIEMFLWGILLILTILLSMYMIASSIFALYIVSLPDMTPMRALKSARILVKYRRWTIMRKVIMLPIFLLLTTAIIMIPLIVISTLLATWIFFLLSMFVLVIVHSYMYTLYRELL